MSAERNAPARRSLRRAFFLIALRGQHYGRATGAKPNELVPPLFWVVGQMLTTSALLTAALFARVDAWFFAFANLSAQLVMLVSALVVELDEVMVGPHDADVLGHHPLSAQDYAAARAANVAAYVLLLSLAASIFPAIVGAGLADAGLLFLPAYAVASIALSVVVVALMVALESVLRRASFLESARAGLAWVQILAILALFYGGQMMLRDGGGGLEVFAADPPAWLRYLPSAWLGDWVAAMARAEFRWQGLVLLAGASALAWTFTTSRLAQLYGSTLHRSFARAKSRPLPAPPLPGTLGRRSGQKPEWRRRFAARWLLTRMLRRDAELRIRVFSALAIPAALLLLAGLMEGVRLPTGTPSTASALPLALLPAVAGCVPFVFHAMSFSRTPEAGLLLGMSASASELREGFRSGALRTIFLPLTLLVFAVFGLRFGDPLGAALYCLLLWLVIDATARVSTRVDLSAPPLSRGASVGSHTGAVTLHSAAATAGAGLVSAAMLFSASDPLRLATLALTLAALDATLRFGLTRSAR